MEFDMNKVAVIVGTGVVMYVGCRLYMSYLRKGIKELKEKEGEIK